MHDLPAQGSHNGFMYFGDRKGWLIVYSQHCDSDTVTRSNFRSFARALGVANATADPVGPNGENDDDTAAVESYGGSFGPGQTLLVRPGSAAETAARRILAALDDYPLVDEEDLSDLESEEDFELVWAALADRYRWHDYDLDRLAGAFLFSHPHPEFAARDCWPDFDTPTDRAALVAGWKQYRAARHA